MSDTAGPLGGADLVLGGGAEGGSPDNCSGAPLIEESAVDKIRVRVRGWNLEKCVSVLWTQ